MSTITKTLAKGGIATAAIGAMALASATPAQARDRHDRGIDAGDVIAGAVILGGIAAIASAASKKDRYHDGYRGDYRPDYRSGYGYRDGDYRDGRRAFRRNSPRRAVRKCIRAAKRDARRYGYRYVDVTQIRDVDDTRYGWKVRGRIVVDGQRGHGYRHRASYDGHGRDYDRGRFTCYVDRGQVTGIKFRGIRGLH